MKRKLLFIALSLPGWILLASYLFYDYEEHGSVENFIEHFFSIGPFYTTLFHSLVLTTPAVSLLFAFFVNERIKLIGELKRVESRYRDYYDNAPYGYHSSDENMTILEVNNTWLDMLGYDRPAVVGVKNVSELLSDESRKRLGKVFNGLKETGRIDDQEMEFLRSDGSILPVMLSSTAVYEGDRFVRSRTIIRDNTDRKTFEQILHAVAEHWENTFNSMPWGVMIVDARCNVLRSNEYFDSNGLVSPDDLAKKYCYNLIHDMGKEGEKDGQGVPVYSDEFIDEANGRFYKLYGRLIYSTEVMQNYVFTVVEISDLKHSEQKLVDSRNAFFNMLKDITAAYKELDSAHQSMILAFANAIDAKSPWTKGHSERVSRYAIALAESMGLNSKELSKLRIAALLHDIGKIGIYDRLLEKPDRLTPEEYEIVKLHPEKSAMILDPIDRFRDIVDVVKYHHEQFDGHGYPYGLKGREIPLMARILCLADSYDSMTADRPYRVAPGRDYAIGELRKCNGTHFDPELVEKFIELIAEGKV